MKKLYISIRNERNYDPERGGIDMTERKIIACHKHGTRLIVGTQFPIDSFVEFEPSKRYGFRTKPWKVTVGLCNGVPEKSVRFKTKKDAMNYFSQLIKE